LSLIDIIELFQLILEEVNPNHPSIQPSLEEVWCTTIHSSLNHTCTWLCTTCQLLCRFLFFLFSFFSLNNYNIEEL